MVLGPEEASAEELKSAGIKEKKGELEVENLKFSPNPSNGKFNLSFSVKEKKKVTINIYNIKGNLVYSETLKDFEGAYNKEIDISGEESGTYFIQIIQGIYDIIKKIIIQ
jgi:flagellar hook assembly protein FlgD